jgi:hypothetical protein
LYNFLENELEGSISGTGRKKMYKDGHRVPREEKGSYSVTIGNTAKIYMSPTKSREPSKTYKGMYETVIQTRKPYIIEYLREFGKYHFPNFEFTDIQVNYNWKSPAHFDKGNLGTSMIIGLGDYTGGELCIEKEDGTETVDIHDTPYKFDGAKFKHWTNDYTGNRMSVVFYSLNKKRLSLDE